MASVWNERLGWLLILAGFATAVGLDPWSLSERDPAALPGSVRMAARHAQAVVVAMGFLQLTVALLLREERLSARLRRVAGWVLLVGTLVYAMGYTGRILAPGSAWLITTGAVVNWFGFALLGWAACRDSAGAEVRAVLAIFLIGMAIDVVSGLYAFDNGQSPVIDIGPEDGVRQRMLRLARVAVTALSLLTLLARDLAAAEPTSHGKRWGQLGLVIGTVGMPTVLTAACFVDLHLKYLLPIPALAMTGGVLVALFQARRTAPPLEQWGWLLVAASMSVGLLIGLYAFDGPFPTPGFMGSYNEFDRRLTRLGHAVCIVLGLLAILLARQSAGRPAALFLIGGTVVTMLGIVLLAFLPHFVGLLVPGPALIVLALVSGVRWDTGSTGLRDTLSGKEPDKAGNPLSWQRNES